MLAVVTAGARTAAAQERLPYAARKLSFSGLGTSVHGDMRTVGMGGASAGLADTFIAAIDSPAGLAMTVGVGDIHYASDDIRDAHLQSAVLHTDSVGLALGLYPWAVSFGYLSPYREEATYELPSLIPTPATLSVTTRELVVSAARVFAHNRLSVGASLVLAQAARELHAPLLGTDQTYASYTAGAVAGAMVQLPRRFLLGASFGTPLHFSAASTDYQARLAIPGFFQPVEVPWRVSLGLGWIANRFFRTDLTLHVLGATPHTALIRDEGALVGQTVTLQPRLGAAYVFADYHELKGTLFLGTYLEWTRIAGTDSRVHGTGGVEARIWIFTVGGGVDLASGYRNYLTSIGVDVFGVLARLEMIPTAWTPPPGRMAPHPYAFSDEGLARPLVKHWDPQGPDVDPIKSGLGIPKKIGRGLKNAGMELKQIGEEISDVLTVETKAQKAQEAQKAAAAAEAELARATEEARRVEAARLAAELAADEEIVRAADAQAAAAAAKKAKRRHPRAPR